MTARIFPARYSDSIMAVLRNIVEAEAYTKGLEEFHVLDPFAGTGRIHELGSVHCHVGVEIITHGIEIEPPTAALHPDTMVGDATKMIFPDCTFDAIVTSPTYGNRFSDRHKPKDASVRRSYTFDIRRLTGNPNYQLLPNNTGAYPFGRQYKFLHRAAWKECHRVLKRGGLMVVNVSDFVKRHKVVEVVEWHYQELLKTGFLFEGQHQIPTARMRMGANHEARVDYEVVLVLRKGNK